MNFLSPERCALLVIDMQNDFCDPRGAVPAGYGLDVSNHEALLPRLERLLASARAAAVPVLYTQMMNEEGTESPAWRARVPRGGGRPVVRAGTWGAELRGVRPAPGEPVIVKRRHTAFHGTDLEVHLRALGRDCLVLTGVNSNVCVESTARDASARDYYAVVVADCCAAYDEAEHRSALHNIRTYFGHVLDSAAVIAAWTGVPASA
jgi:ureidoacrylate peracid hydrolase